jgi:hypothetical protein
VKENQIQKILDDWEIVINSNPWTPLFPYPCCCVCFVKLTSKNVLLEDNKLINVCLECKNK